MGDLTKATTPEEVSYDFGQLYPSTHSDSHLTLMQFRDHYAWSLKKIVEGYIKDPDKYVYTFNTSVNGKLRPIVTYQNTTEGQLLRRFHRMFANMIGGIYQSHSDSYAYQKGKSIELCLEKHLYSDSFLKSDIHAFFDSVSFELLSERILSLASWGARLKGIIPNALRACVYNGHLPIGFISSPLLSDIYLYDLDEAMSTLKDVCYTRYADDFIISTSGEQATERLESAHDRLKQELKNHKLDLNSEKTYNRRLKEKGDYIHLLGLNIVKTDGIKNRITVSHKYIVNTSKELGFLLKNRDSIESWEMRRRFSAVMGKISFIANASKDSLEKLKKLICIKTGLELDLTYKALDGILIKDVSEYYAYARQKQRETFERIKKIIRYPISGRTWERLTIPAKKNKTGKRLTSSERDKMREDDALWENYINRGTLRSHLFAICREFERGNAGGLKINRMELTVGD